MKRLSFGVIALFICAFSTVNGQALAPRSPSANASEAAQLQALAKKIDEQNAKIDMLSQEILKLEQQLANTRPGVMIGEATPSASTTPSAAEAARSANANGGNGHTVMRGETLTSIAKMYNVSVSELQKYNHIENPLKLQAGQTLMIPPSPTPPASPTPPQ